MFIIIGLGNPGSEYKKTRHNVGFLVLDLYAKKNKSNFISGRGSYLETSFRIQRHNVLLIKPTTYMNLSGNAVRAVFEFFKFEQYLRSLIIIDDINLPFGTIRLRPGGSDGGHKGLRSIISHIGSQHIPRLRIGIGNNFSNTSNYVLSPFRKNEKKDLEIVLQWAVDAVESFVVNGIELTMNRFNRNVLTI